MPDANVDELFARVAAGVAEADAGIEQGKILHSVGLKTGGKFFAFVARGELVLKLPAGRVDELVTSGGRRFDASKGRPMKEWVCVRPADEEACAAYVAEARRFVGGVVSPAGD